MLYTYIYIYTERERERERKREEETYTYIHASINKYKEIYETIYEPERNRYITESMYKQIQEYTYECIHT